MSLTLLFWLALFAILTLLAFWRPVFGVSVYMLSYFACPPFWWWGDPIEDYRWNLYGGMILLAAILASPRGNFATLLKLRPIFLLAGLFLFNATGVHFFLAEDLPVSAESYSALAKIILLFFMMVLAVRSKRDLQIVMLSILLGAGYIGYEATINDRGSIEDNRLEGIGAPNASQANQFASLMVTVLPLTAPFFLAGRRGERLAMILIGPFVVNVVLLCNSRAGFLAAITSAIAFVIVAPRAIRRDILKIVLLGLIATWLLLGDPRIVERFSTTFSPGEQRDASSEYRIRNWKAGLEMIQDYPLGAGGHGFKKVHWKKYITNDGPRSLHSGYINDAVEWGVQGLALHIALIIATMYALWRARPAYDRFWQITSCALFAGLAAFLVTCFFGDFLDAEWGYWILAMAAAQVAVFSQPAAVEQPELLPATA